MFGVNGNVNQMFTGQERDGTTAQLSYFHARQYSAAMGMFMQPDPGNAGADITRPQSWNAYGYVLGNPLNGADPSGMVNVGIVDKTGEDDCFSAERSEPCGGFPDGGGWGGGGSGWQGVSAGGADSGTPVLPLSPRLYGGSSFWQSPGTPVWQPPANPIIWGPGGWAIPGIGWTVEGIARAIGCWGSGVCEFAAAAGVVAVGAAIVLEGSKGEALPKILP